MAPIRGRGAFRGRGRGRRSSRGGRGGRGGWKPGFAAPRVAEEIEDGVPSSPEASESEDEQEDLVGAPSDEEEAKPMSTAFHSLLQTFQQSSTSKERPRKKRRKIQHISTHSEDEDDIQEHLKDEEEAADSDVAEEAAAETLRVEDDEDDEDQADPFEVHFANPDDNELQKRLKAIAENRWTSEKIVVSGGGKCLFQAPEMGEKAVARSKVRSPNDVKLKNKLALHAHEVLGSFSELEQAVAPALFDYQDVMFGGRTVQNAKRLRDMTCLHALNHIFKTRDRVIKNNGKLAREQQDNDAEYRDQGFTRPKVLFLLETKQACVRAVDSMTQLCDFDQQENKKRFMDGYSQPEDKFQDDRPDDFRELFEGNDENELRVGLKFTRKTMKFFAKFYNSDIIFASPLGLRRAIESGDPKKKDSDFLSSIEIVVMEQADAALMQNWEHVEFVFDHLNLQPKEAHGCDFSRVRNWYLDGYALNFRQTIVLSAYLTPKINTLYSKHMRNAFGRLKYTPDYTSGAIETLTYGIKQTFSRFDSPSHISDPDARFKFFSSTILPYLSRLPKPVEGGLGVVIFIPSYLDFVRLRNSLVDTDWSYGLVSEYTDATAVRRARSHFMSGKHSLLLYTGRAHHFHRYLLRGVKRVVFYGVPENTRFYEEAVGWIGRTLERVEASKAETSVRMCFSRWERMELERVVGSKRVGKMVNEKGDTFDFV